MASTQVDSHIVSFCAILSDDAKEEEFVRQFRLAPVPSAVRPKRASAGGKPTSELWGVCNALGFNPDLPNCIEKVGTYRWKSANGFRAAFRCNTCKRKLSQLCGIPALRGRVREGRFLARVDCLGRPNVHFHQPGSAVVDELHGQRPPLLPHARPGQGPFPTLQADKEGF